MSSTTAHLFEYDDEDPPEPEYFVADDDGDQIPPDPLLKSGTFILEPTTLTTELPQSTQNGVAADPVQLSVDREPPEQCTSPPGVSKGTTERVKTSSAAATGVDSTPRKKGQPQVVSGAVPERPNWLPEGWRAECKVRTSGASAGSFDKYYIEPVSGRKFRSKVEVDYFLQTGSKPNKKRNPDADAEANANRPEKSGSKKKKSAPLNFDFNNLPEKVRWVLTDAVKDQWTPFVGDKIITKSTRQEWNAAFQFSCS